MGVFLAIGTTEITHVKVGVTIVYMISFLKELACCGNISVIMDFFIFQYPLCNIFRHVPLNPVNCMWLGTLVRGCRCAT